MAQGVAVPPLGSPGFIGWLRDILNRTQKVDEDFEPPGAIGTATRVILRDTNGVRYAVTVSTLGALVVTAL